MDLHEVDIANHDNYIEAFPYEMFDVLRREDPVHLHEDPYEGVPFWALTKHEDIVYASRRPEIYSSFERTSIFREPTMNNELEELQLMMVNQDPPEHTRLRSIVNSGFTPRVIARLEERIRDYTNAIVDRALEEGEGDFVRWVSAELPLEVIAELMGAPIEERDFIFEISNRLIGFDDPEFQTSPEDARVAAAEMFTYAENLRQQREAEPRDDIVTALVNAEVDGNRLSEMEFDLFFILLAVAGNETTRNAISHGMQALFDHPGEWKKLKAEPSLLDTAADEIIRWAHPVIQFRRTAMRDDVIRGREIRDGDKVVLWYASGNRDEDVFEAPYTFDVARAPNPHISFGGGGPHYCLGAHLAKLEIRIMFDVIADRMPDIEPAGEVRRLRSNFINGIKTMPVRFTP
ncbi:MAG: cytochrome P450 [Actinobacteria bacterium]|nr:cytochrome P450 [Actinomycetota bacterium]